MKVHLLALPDKIIWFLTIILISSMTIFESYTWGKYILVLVTAIIFTIDSLQGRVKYSIDRFQIFMLAFTTYTFFSSLWAINMYDSLEKTGTLIQVFICMWILYNHYSKVTTVLPILSSIKWSSYIISAYSIYYYGYSNIIYMTAISERLDNSYANVNTLGMLAVIGILIQLDEIMRKKRISISLLCSVPSWIIGIATQSRKALLMLIIGTMLLFTLKKINSRKNIIKNIFIILGILCGMYFIISQLATLDVFSGITRRMEGIFSLLSGEGHIDRSSRIRENMIQLGIEIFKENPILGIGIGCPHILATTYLNFDAYLHNNFVELLAGGGAIGFLIFYSGYAYLFFAFKKYAKFKDEYFYICLVLLILFFGRDYAMVSYPYKDTYFYFMMFFLAVKQMKRRSNIFYKRNIIHKGDRDNVTAKKLEEGTKIYHR